MSDHPYIVRYLGQKVWSVWHVDDSRRVSGGLDRKSALSMRDRLNDQARRATSIAPPHARG